RVGVDILNEKFRGAALKAHFLLGDGLDAIQRVALLIGQTLPECLVDGSIRLGVFLLRRAGEAKAVAAHDLGLSRPILLGWHVRRGGDGILAAGARVDGYEVV